MVHTLDAPANCRDPQFVPRSPIGNTDVCYDAQHMELRHLRYFTSVAEQGGIGRTARLLHVSQSAISEQLKDLEDELGVPLFDRSKRTIQLTDHGERFLADAHNVLSAAERAVINARRSLRGEIGTLSIGFFVGGTAASFPVIIREFRKRFPGVQVSLVEMAPALQHNALLGGVIDIGFTRPVHPSETSTLRSEHYHTEKLLAILHCSHKLARRRSIFIRELANDPFVINDRNHSSAVFDKIITLCANAGFSPRIESVGTVSPGVIALVEAGAGVAVLPQGSRVFSSREVEFVPLADPDATIDLVMAWAPERENPALLAFLDLARRKNERRQKR
jgi:DNA-binding transcriptional LysR family regulator